MRWVIAGGGTGGHLFPGLALAKAALQADSGAELLFLGAERGIESRVVEEAGYRLERLAVKPFRGLSILGRLEAVVGLGPAVLGARSVLSSFGADLVVGVGGYASFPGVVAAYSLRLPIILLEQNMRPGLANKLLGHLADRVCVSFPETVACFPAGVAVHTGNPVRFAARRRPSGDHPLSILIIGGSAGAHRLNVELPGAIGLLGDKAKSFSILHQTGVDDLDYVKEEYRKIEVRAEVTPFIDDMAAAYENADLVICRCGATTVAELTAMGKPAILVPYPFASDQHQQYNAESLVRAGAAKMILEEDLSAGRLAREIDSLSRNRLLLDDMAERSSRLGNPDAASRVLEQCLLMVERRKAAE